MLPDRDPLRDALCVSACFFLTALIIVMALTVAAP